MANFEGGDGAIPGVYDKIETNSSGVSVPGGSRIAVLVGEGLRSETLASNANGRGKDGLNANYSGTNGSDGRHFKLSNFPIQTNRTKLYKNGIPLNGVEEAPNGNSFSSLYDYRIDIATGKVELQGASLVDQGGQNYLGSLLNVGDGTISQLTLADVNAPTETWTIRCVSVRRDGYGDPIDGYAKFIAQGSVSGIKLDGYGNNVSWQSNGIVISNGILSFAVNEGVSDAFREGDKFTIKVKGGALTRGESLVANYIAIADLNDPEQFTDINSLVAKHGSPSVTNRLSLAAQLAFASRPPSVYACQAAPSVPRRVSYILEESASGNAAADDLNFALPLGVVPDVDSNINFFITDPITETESQIIPNKVAFYDSSITSSQNTFHFGAGYSYSYTVILDPNYKILSQADDGVLTNLTGTTATLSSQTLTFGSLDAVSTRRIRILTPNSNAGIYEVVSVSGGAVTILRGSGSFTDSTSVEFEVLDQDGNGARVLFTDDLAPSAGQIVRATVVDTKDADFFDVGWQNAYDALETIEIDIVVPVPSQTISACFAIGRAHCETMSNVKNRKERVLFIGAIRGLDPENVTGEEPAAVEDIGVLEGIQGDEITEILGGDVEDLADYGVQNSYGGTFRVVYFYPDEIVVQIGADRTFVDGFFMAASAAGYLCAVPSISQPLTNKILPGFTILRDKLFRPIILEQLTAAGVCVIQPALGGGTVIWGKTTTNSGFPEEEEISIVFIRDRIAKDLRVGLRAFIGKAEDDTTQGSIMARASSLMTSFIARRLITAWKDLVVIRDKVDPRQWNVTVNVQPVYPINFVWVKVGIGVL